MHHYHAANHKGEVIAISLDFCFQTLFHPFEHLSCHIQQLGVLGPLGSTGFLLELQARTLQNILLVLKREKVLSDEASLATNFIEPLKQEHSHVLMIYCHLVPDNWPNNDGIKRVTKDVVAIVRHEFEVVAEDRGPAAFEGNTQVRHKHINKMLVSLQQQTAPQLVRWLQSDVDHSRSVHCKLKRIQNPGNVEADQKVVATHVLKEGAPLVANHFDLLAGPLAAQPV